MKTIEYTYRTNGIVNVIQLKVSQNSKIGFGIVVQTYHFSLEQIYNLDLKRDAANCLDCPLSFSNGHLLGKCYTHKGMQYFGLMSMLKRLNKDVQNIKEFDKSEFETFLNKANGIHVSLVRFGAYGEPIFLGEEVVKALAGIGKNISGYTHQWRKKEHNWAKGYFMASAHSQTDRINAKLKGFRSFHVVISGNDLQDSVNCPSSKESEQQRGKKVSCINCALCSGTYKNLKKDIHINIH